MKIYFKPNRTKNIPNVSTLGMTYYLKDYWYKAEICLDIKMIEKIYLKTKFDIHKICFLEDCEVKTNYKN